MNKDLVFLGVAGAALLGAFVATRPKVVAGVMQTLTPADFASGPAYLVSNQPWTFGQPATAVLPPAGNALVGAPTVKPTPAFTVDCGCGA